LPLMGSGDWNDGLNLVGAGGKGESVWLAWFMAEVLKGMSEMSGLLGRTDIAVAYDRERQDLVDRVETSRGTGVVYPGDVR